MNQASDLKRPLREQGIRMEEQLKANRIGWPAAFMIFSVCAAAALIAWAASCG